MCIDRARMTVAETENFVCRQIFLGYGVWRRTKIVTLVSYVIFKDCVQCTETLPGQCRLNNIVKSRVHLYVCGALAAHFYDRTKRP